MAAWPFNAHARVGRDGTGVRLQRIDQPFQVMGTDVVVVVQKELIKVETVTNQVLAVRTVAVVESDKIYLN